MQRRVSSASSPQKGCFVAGPSRQQAGDHTAFRGLLPTVSHRWQGLHPFADANQSTPIRGRKAVLKAGQGGAVLSSTMPLEHLLTVKEVASLLRVSTQTLYKMLENGEIPAVKVGSQWRFDSDRIKEWISSQASHGAAGRPTAEAPSALTSPED